MIPLKPKGGLNGAPSVLLILVTWATRRQKRSAEAAYWNVLSDWKVEHLQYE